MTDLNHMIEQHIREHQARSKHIDELAGKVRERLGESSEHKEARSKLAELLAERDRLMGRVDRYRAMSREQWREDSVSRSGLMGIWDAIAQALERLAERLSYGR